MIPLPYVKPLKLGSYGSAVSGAKRATYRLLDNGVKWTGYINQTAVEQRTFGPFYRKDLISLQHQMSVGRDGWFDEETLRALESSGAFDAKARVLWLAQFPPAPVLIEPKQGFKSLVEDLWLPYTSGRQMGLTDLGTYNPASLLPSGAPSDHATSRLDGRIGEPACAFDLGISPQNGYDNPVGRKFFDEMMGHQHVHYVILGTKIWSTDKGLHEYTLGGHENHVHTSGFRR